MNSRRITAALTASILMAFLYAPASASEKVPVHLEYGCEWGCTATLYHYYHIDYTARGTGSRVDVQEPRGVFRPVGDILFYIGAEIGDKCSVDLNCGYGALFDDRRVVPVTVRATFFPKGRKHLATKVFIEGGSAFAKTYDGGLPAIAKLGTGKRVELARRISMDVDIALQMAMDRPDSAFDYVHNVQVTPSQLLFSRAVYAGINLSLSLNFR